MLFYLIGIHDYDLRLREMLNTYINGNFKHELRDRFIYKRKEADELLLIRSDMNQLEKVCKIFFEHIFENINMYKIEWNKSIIIYNF